MRVAVSLCGLFLLITSVLTNTFEVKVLLKKDSKQFFKKNSFYLQSKSGFVVTDNPVLSVGKEYHQSSIDPFSDNFLKHHLSSMHQSSCYIRPALSEECKQYLYKEVLNWFQFHKNELQQRSFELHGFFDKFVHQNSQQGLIPYDVLITYILDLVTEFLQDTFFKSSSMPVILKKYVQSYVKSKIVPEFLDQLAFKKLNKQDRQLLAKSKDYRYEFFTGLVHDLTKNVLKKVIILLPHRYLSELFDQKVGTIFFEENEYLGSFLIFNQKDIVYVINCLDIDDYLLSVVRHEGWPGWPIEVNKVLAITCRTYLVWQILQAQRLKRPYHIENGIKHQTYKGHHKYVRLKQAIDETKDICIAYENKPILAMFDACCGGVVAEKLSVQDLKKHPYLAKKERCCFCTGCKVASWNVEFSYDQMLELLQKEIHSLSSIDTIKVVNQGDNSVVDKVIVSCQGQPISISGKKMYAIFPEIKSFCFDIQTFPKQQESCLKEFKKKKRRHKKIKEDVVQHHEQDSIKKFVINGKGYGHHIGLCQWGAMKLVKEHHWSYERILQFYYPNTSLIKLSYSG